MSYTRDDLLSLLASGVHQITVTKADGSIRTIAGTRDPSILEQLDERFDPNRKPSETSTINSNHIAIFECTSSSWKSFAFDRLISVDGVVSKQIVNILNKLI